MFRFFEFRTTTNPSSTVTSFEPRFPLAIFRNVMTVEDTEGYDPFPQSVEEAAALLGATITTLGRSVEVTIRSPPAGMHSVFTVQSLTSSPLLRRLYYLRALLRSADESSSSLPSAPSILAVLMKLLSISNTMGQQQAGQQQTNPLPSSNSGSVSTATTKSSGRQVTPMLSTPIRGLWADCVVLCHATAEKGVDTVQFLRKLLDLVALNPRSKKAAGGIRLASLHVIRELLKHSSLQSSLAPWAVDVLPMCLRSIKSSGQYDPSFRILAIETAQATVCAARKVGVKRLEQAQDDNSVSLMFRISSTTLEDKAMLEAVRLCKTASQDKFPEVRLAAATLAGMLAPMLITGGSSDPLLLLEDIVQLCCRNLDDSSPATAMEWAETMARCLAAARQHHEEDSNPSNAAAPSRFSRRQNGITHIECVSLKSMLNYLVNSMVKVGGELVAPRCGGTYSVGGRSVRIGWGWVLAKLLRLEMAHGNVIVEDDEGGNSESKVMLLLNVAMVVLDIVGPVMEQQWQDGNASSGVFGSTRSASKGDSGMARMVCNRCIRHGISEVIPETTQLAFLRDLISLLPGSGSVGQDAKKSTLNASQLQVVAIEISHLVATLGDAAAGQMVDLLRCLEPLLGHTSQGVRHEAAVACAAVTSCFPDLGRKLVASSTEAIQAYTAQIISLSTTKESAASPPRMSFRAGKKKEPKADPIVPHQCAIHGHSLMISMLIRDLPCLSGGISSELLKTVLSAAKLLIAFQFQSAVLQRSPFLVCICVKSGFRIVSGVLSTGPESVSPHMPLLFQSWNEASKTNSEYMELAHEVSCIEDILTSVVVFLKFCPELLLAIPQALTQVTDLLETILPQFLPDGRLGKPSTSPVINAKRDSCRSCLLEAFAWLPSGSFPMIADSVFDFASDNIRASVENEVTCSILYALVNREDAVLDAKTLSRANREGQVGGAKDLEETILLQTGEVSSHEEREAVMLLIGSEHHTGAERFRGSRTLALYAFDHDNETPPTPLHGIGTWRRPINPSGASRVRLIDAAIQAFSATFGLKSGSEQQVAMDMLESLVPPLLAQLARTLGVNAATVDQSPRARGKEDHSAVVNITAVLLSCLKALPLHEASHNVPIGLGPPWMTKAKDLLLTLLPSPSSFVRRAAAEGLSLLASLGVTEDAHFLQSTVLHSLDEVMQGNKPDGKPRTIALEPISAARAGSLLTLACIQRTAENVARRQMARARSRVTRNAKVKQTNEDEELPILQMMSRILPSLDCFGFRDYFVVRTYAIHSFEVLLVYSGRLKKDVLDEVDLQLLRKGVELVEENFAAAWMVASSDIDKGQEAEKLTTEVAFLSSLLRFMSFLTASVHHLRKEDAHVAERFVLMARLILEHHGVHPAVSVEAMAFFELVVCNRSCLPQPWTNVEYTESPVFAVVPSVMSALATLPSPVLKKGAWESGCLPSSMNMRAVSSALGALYSTNASINEWSDFKSTSLLFASLNSYYSSRCFAGCSNLRSLAAPRSAQLAMTESTAVEYDIIRVTKAGASLDIDGPRTGNVPSLRWILFCGALLTNSTVDVEVGEDLEPQNEDMSREKVINAARKRAAVDFGNMISSRGQTRWQVKCVAAQMASFAIASLRVFEQEINSSLAREECAEESAKASKDVGLPIPESKMVFHLRDIVSSACISTSATLNQTELHLLQTSAMYNLSEIIEAFALCPDPDVSGAQLLDQFSQQIFSSIKHGLSAPSESKTIKSFHLFAAACRCLTSAVELKMTTEETTLRRLVRPVVPQSNEVSPFSVSSSYPTISEDINSLSKRLSIVSRILCCSKLLLGTNKIPVHMNVITGEIVQEKFGIAIHAAAFATDGARLLLMNRTSLAGRKLDAVDDDYENASLNGPGYIFSTSSDIDDQTKSLLVKEWSSFASASVRPLVEGFNAEDTHVTSKGWLEKVIPLLLAGIRQGRLAPVFKKSSRPSWLAGVSHEEILINCICGLNSVVAVDDYHNSVLGEYSAEILSIFNELVDTTWSLNASIDSPARTSLCLSDLAISLSKHSVFNAAPTFLQAILKPIVSYQEQEHHNLDPPFTDIICACIHATKEVVDAGKADESILATIIEFASESLGHGAKMETACKCILRSCFSSSSVNDGYRAQLSKKFSECGNWDAWLETFSQESSSESIDIVKLRLHEPDAMQAELLQKLSSYIQKNEDPKLSHFLLNKIGGDIVSLLYAYGTLNIPDTIQHYRKQVCTDSAKVALSSYMMITSRGDDSGTCKFLLVYFEVLLAVLRYNGVPNHPLPQHGSDPSLGRLSAQAILHAARTSPAPFKEAVAQLSEQERSLLEFAVRAEMNGYVVQTQAPKKISLQGFKK